ncbi:MAG TPA: sigma-70 family RNA polymerase sigma factor [Acidimicrobiales bacterium]|nr:sigma-70 family RNA polymerase sigma factor [Acidimicrobiales bacterium]
MDELTALAVAARAGDQAALGAFVRGSQADVWRFCAYLLSPDRADDATQDTYLRAVRALPRYRADAPALRWLLSIARHACADTLRRESRRAELAVEFAEPTRASHAAVVDLFDLISRLEPDRRAAFVLTQILGLSYAEAGEVCACPIGTIRSRVARAREALVAALVDDECDLGERGNWRAAEGDS